MPPRKNPVFEDDKVIVTCDDGHPPTVRRRRSRSKSAGPKLNKDGTPRKPRALSQYNLYVKAKMEQLKQQGVPAKERLATAAHAWSNGGKSTWELTGQV